MPEFELVLDDADDLAAVFHWRVDAWVEKAQTRRRPAADLVAGLILHTPPTSTTPIWRVRSRSASR